MQAKDVVFRLAEQVESVVKHLLPEGCCVGNEWRVGSVNGESGKSLGVVLTGDKRGIWSAVYQRILRQAQILAQTAVRYAANHLSERDAVFGDNDLKLVALAYEPGKVTPERLNQALDKAVSNKSLLGIKASDGRKTYWTTPWAIAMESETVGMIKAVKHIAEQEGFTIRGMAPSASATQQLEQGAGIKSQTLPRIIRELSHKTDNSNYQKTLFVLDEASMASTKQMHDLVKLVTQHNSRLILLGDSKQLPAVEAGKPFSLAQAFGMETVVMKDILRQQNLELRQGVYDLIDGKVKDAFDKIQSLHEIDNKQERLSAIAHDYLQRSTQERTQTLVLIPKHEDRHTVNHLIRAGLQQENQLQGPVSLHQAVTQKNLTYTEQLRAKNYFPGDIVRFNRTYKTLGIKSGEYLTVLETAQKRLKKNSITLQNTAGKTIHWNPGKVAKHKGAVEVYQARDIELQAGDKIIWRRNFTDTGIVNGQTAHVIEIKDEHIQLTLQDGKQINLNKDTPALKHIDYSYTMTDYSAQGKSYQHVIAHSESHQKFLTTQQAFYVQVSRAVNSMMLYTDNKERLIQQLEHTPGGKTSAVLGLDASVGQQINRGEVVKSGGIVRDGLVSLEKVGGERELER